jgi:hypothetical protein
MPGVFGFACIPSTRLHAENAINKCTIFFLRIRPGPQDTIQNIVNEIPPTRIENAKQNTTMQIRRKPTQINTEILLHIVEMYEVGQPSSKLHNKI